MEKGKNMQETEDAKLLKSQQAKAQKRAGFTEDERFLAPRGRVEDFTRTDTWRIFRIISEFVEGFEMLAELGPAVTIFGSARTPEDHPMYEAAVEVSKRLAEKGLGIITGGGPGIMEAGNKGAKKGDGLSVGLNIELPFEQHLNPYADISLQFHYFFVRKTLFLKYASAFVIFPGGFGTMDECFESLTLIQTGKVKNFPVVLFGSDYWSGLMDWVKNTMLKKGNISEGDLDLMIISDSVEDTVDHIVSSLQEDSERQKREEGAREATRKAYNKNRD
ncbi:MAG: TIGR00730 family Rossman fold protein [Candidatus Sumerlaeia bacterium]